MFLCRHPINYFNNSQELPNSYSLEYYIHRVTRNYKSYTVTHKSQPQSYWWPLIVSLHLYARI